MKYCHNWIFFQHTRIIGICKSSAYISHDHRQAQACVNFVENARAITCTFRTFYQVRECKKRRQCDVYGWELLFYMITSQQSNPFTSHKYDWYSTMLSAYGRVHFSVESSAVITLYTHQIRRISHKFRDLYYSCIQLYEIYGYLEVSKRKDICNICKCYPIR